THRQPPTANRQPPTPFSTISKTTRQHCPISCTADLLARFYPRHLNFFVLYTLL
ncbi:hypothetical protein LTS18_010039, partial [Coniosporium uncinatum]